MPKSNPPWPSTAMSQADKPIAKTSTPATRASEVMRYMGTPCSPILRGRWRGSSRARRRAAAARGPMQPRLIELDRDELRHPRFFHRHAVEPVGYLHGLAVVRDDDELGAVEHGAQHLDEAADVGIVERRVDLVEQAEGARLV